MSESKTIEINIGAEIDRLFEDSSRADPGEPRAVILAGGVAVGKTTIRKRDYATGFVVIDAAEIFHHLTGDAPHLDFPGPILEPLELIGSLVARRAASEKRHIVTEIIGSELEPTTRLISALKSAGYTIEFVTITCDFEESVRRNANRGNNVSAYYAEPFQRKWIVDACSDLAS